MYILNQDGSIIDLDQYLKDHDQLMQAFLANDSSKIPKIKPGLAYWLDDQSYYRMEAHGWATNDPNDLINIKSKDVEKIFNVKTMSEINRQLHPSGLPREIKEIEKVMDDYNDKKFQFKPNTKERDDFHHKHMLYQAMFYTVRHKLYVFLSLVFFYRTTFSLLRKGEVFTERCPMNQKLIHLSYDENLKSPLEPRYPRNESIREVIQSEDQILPKRISFSPSIEESLYGIPYGIKTHLDYNQNGASTDVFVYQGIVDSNTLKVKDKYTKQTIGEWNYSHEIAITTKIHVKKIGKVRIHFDNLRLEDIRSVYGDSWKKWILKQSKIEWIEKY